MKQESEQPTAGQASEESENNLRNEAATLHDAPIRISVITVCYNCADTIRDTVESVLGQRYPHVEYVVIDGASTDGTREILEEYRDRIAVLVSEPDSGIYDAMNKGVLRSTGDYVVMMNSGDTFVDADTVARSVARMHSREVDVYYGDSIEVIDGHEFYRIAGDDPSALGRYVIYRHGASYVNGATHKRFLFDLERRRDLGYALDFHQIHRMWRQGCRFEHIDVAVMRYPQEGVSANRLQSIRYVFKITHEGESVSLKTRLRHRASLAWHALAGGRRTGRVVHGVFNFLLYLANGPVGSIPCHRLRHAFFRLLGARIGKGTVLNMKQYFFHPSDFSIGEYSHINRGCILDARGGIHIGNSVSISYRSMLLTGGHDYRSRTFRGKFYPIIIDDYAWIGAGVTVLQGVRIGRGAVVASGSVVTRNVEPYTIVGGVPARKLGTRPTDLDYKCEWELPFA